jgi:hypothetical protein
MYGFFAAPEGIMTSELPRSRVLLQRIEHTYEEQPDLRLTPLQAHRFSS